MKVIAFRHSHRLVFARVVCLVRGGDTAHCEAGIVADPADRVAWCVSASFLDTGVRGKSIDLSDPAKWRVYAVPTWLEMDIRGWLAAHDGWGYDLLGLLGIVWRPLGHSRRKAFCSEAVAAMLGLPEPELYDPRTLESVVQRFCAPVRWDGQRWAPALSVAQGHAAALNPP